MLLVKKVIALANQIPYSFKHERHTLDTRKAISTRRMQPGYNFTKLLYWLKQSRKSWNLARNVA